MKITKEVVEAIKKTQTAIVEEISSKEEWSIEKSEIISEGWKELMKNMEEIGDKNDLNNLFLLLFSYLNTGDMLSFVMELNKAKPAYFNDFFKTIEEYDTKEKKELSLFLKDKLMVIYRMNTIPRIFAEDRISALQIALNKY